MKKQTKKNYVGAKVILVVNEEKTITKILKTNLTKKEIRKKLKKNAKEQKTKIEIIKIKLLTSKKFKKELVKQKKKEQKEIIKIKKQELKQKRKEEKQKKLEERKLIKQAKKEEKELLKQQRKQEREKIKLEKKQQKMLKKLEGKKIFEIVVSKADNEELHNKISTHITKATTMKNLDLVKARLIKSKLYTEEQIKNLYVIAKEIPADNWELVLQANKNNII